MDKLPDEISISWHIDDVKYIDGQREDDLIPELTDDECREVLQRVKNNHDASIGVNWDTLAYYANEVRDEREDQNGRE